MLCGYGLAFGRDGGAVRCHRPPCRMPARYSATSRETLGAADLKSIQYSGTGFTFAFAQNYRPDCPYPKFHATYSRAIDYERGLAREETVRTQFENPPRGGGGQPLYTEARGAAIVTGIRAGAAARSR